MVGFSGCIMEVKGKCMQVSKLIHRGSTMQDEVLVKLPLSHVLSADFCQPGTQIGSLSGLVLKARLDRPDHPTGGGGSEEELRSR